MQDLLHPIFLTHQDAIYCVDRSGTTLLMNRAAAELFGTAPDARISGEARQKALGSELAAAERRVFESGEITYIDLTGRAGSFSFEIAPTHDPEGIVNGLWVQGRDVWNLRQSEATEGIRESRLNAALEIAGQGVWESDLEQHRMYYSRTWKLLRGIDPDEEITAPPEAWLDRVHPDDRDRVNEIVSRQDRGEIERRTFEYRERHKDGHWIWIASLSAPIEWLPDGRPRRIIGTDTDITQRKLAEDQVARLSQRLELALDVSKIGVFESAIRSGALYWDDRLRDLYGVPRGDNLLTAADWESALHPDDAERAKKKVARAIEKKGPFVLEFRIIRPGGQIVHMRSRATYYVDPGGDAKFVGCCWDVTADVLLNESLERAKNLAEARNLEIEAAKAISEHESLHDALTGLPNRRYLDQLLRQQADDCAGHGGGVALLHIDLDRFKQINDTLGHLAGDAMLVHVAKLLRAAASGPEHFVARVGGDEFMLVCRYDARREDLARLAEAIITKVRQPVPYEAHLCRFGASIGVATGSGAEIDPHRLLINADVALYRAKRRGRNRHEFFSDELQAEIATTKRIADDILRGIEQNEFIPYYQPLFDAHTLTVAGVEALARWAHPKQGILAPNAFLKIAEDLNVVATIDRMILSQALDDYASWTEAGLTVPSVSVNVSFKRLHEQELIASLKNLAIPRGVFSFELLESIFLDEVDPIVGWNLDQINDLGVAIDIDDFGTGHASIVSLLKLSPRRFKIDRQFVTPIVDSPDQRRLMGSLVDIGKSLGIRVVAEGVETMAQAAILKKLGCDLLQGFALARPMPANALAAFLRSRPVLKRAS